MILIFLSNLGMGASEVESPATTTLRGDIDGGPRIAACPDGGTRIAAAVDGGPRISAIIGGGAG